MTDDWRQRAACRGLDHEMFYPVSRDGWETAEALGVCRSCPVRPACLDDALSLRDVWGVRGGLTGGERDALLRRNRRAAAIREGAVCKAGHVATEDSLDAWGRCADCRELKRRQARLRQSRRRAHVRGAA